MHLGRNTTFLIVIRNHCLFFKNSLHCSFIRNASNFRRPLLNAISRETTEDLRVNYFQNQTHLNRDQWKTIQEKLLRNYKHINKQNLDAVILGICTNSDYLPLAKNYIQLLREEGNEPNLATLGRLLKIYNLSYHARGANDSSLSNEEQIEILHIYENLRKKHKIFDAVTCENLILGLVTTKQWRDAVDLLEMIKITAKPTVNAYSEVIIKAFSMDDMQLAWDILHAMLNDRKQPKCEIFITYFKVISKARDPREFQDLLEKLLKFLEKYELTITQNVVAALESLNAKKNFNIIAKTSKVSRQGKCSNCGQVLQNVSISDEEFQKLRDSFLQRVLIGKDIFQKSSPQEIERFKYFVEQTAPYDCVIDGLNVAYSTGSNKSPKILSHLVASVVKYFADQHKYVLVLGRQHMERFPQEDLRYIKQNASVFLTDDLSYDDPFLLYATLKSGQNTDFFSRDLMRSHAFLLGPELRPIFRRWQQEHQYSLLTQTDIGKIIIKKPVRHLIHPHKMQDTWHLPFKMEYSSNPPEVFEIPSSWLCINFKK